MMDRINWNEDIKELEAFFRDIELPKEPIKLNPVATIINLSLFVKSHLNTIKSNKGKATFLPYLDRLKELKQILTKQ